MNTEMWIGEKSFFLYFEFFVFFIFSRENAKVSVVREVACCSDHGFTSEASIQPAPLRGRYTDRSERLYI